MISYSYITKLMAVVFVLQNWNTNVYSHKLTPESVSENKSSDVLIDMLNTAESALHSAKQFAKLNVRRISDNSDADPLLSNPIDCAEIYQRNKSAKSGIYDIWPRSRIVKCSIKVYCDMDDDGGAWTAIQRRGDFDSPQDYFYRNWISYKNGFGDLLRDFWLGNDNIFALTNERANSVKFILSDWEGNTTYAIYDEFWIDDEAHNYTAHVAGYRGKAGDSFSFTNNIPFSTKDKDNDKHTSNCAVAYKGAWWYAACHSSNLNGYYLKGAHDSYADGVEWSAFRGQRYSLMDTVIKIRPKDFSKSFKSDMTPQ